MSKKRYTIQGYRDYRGVPLKDIVEDLKEFELNTKADLKKLIDLKKKAEKRKDSLDDFESVLDYLDHWISLFKGFEYDFNRVVNLLEHDIVKEKHLDIINEIYNTSFYEHKNTERPFKREHMSKTLKDESIRPLLDEIYVTAGGVYFRNLVLIDLNDRLRTFLGESLKEFNPNEKKHKKSVIKAQDKKAKTYPIPTCTFPTPKGSKWDDVRITFLSEKAIRINVMDEQDGKDYIELGFAHEKSKKMRRAWKVLHEFAIKDGEISYKDKEFIYGEVTRQLKTRIYELNKWFGLYFVHIEGNAIGRYNRHHKSYRARFEIHLHNAYREEIGYL